MLVKMKLEEPYNLIRTAESGLKAKMWSNEWRKIDREKRVREKCPKGKHGESKKKWAIWVWQWMQVSALRTRKNKRDLLRS